MVEIRVRVNLYTIIHVITYISKYTVLIKIASKTRIGIARAFLSWGQAACSRWAAFAWPKISPSA